MKQFKWRKLAAVLLVVCLSVGMVTPASAAGLFSSGRSSGLLGSLTDRWNNLWNSIFGGAQEEEPAEDAGNTETESGDLTLVEDETTVTEGTDLRASTYSLELLAGRTEDLKYFPVTLYNYGDAYNDAMHRYEVDNHTYTSTWNGIYFGGNGHGATTNDKDSFSVGATAVYQVASPTYDQILRRDRSSWQDTDYYYKDGNNYYPLVAKRDSEWDVVDWEVVTTYTYTFGYKSGRNIEPIKEVETTSPQSTLSDITVYTYISPGSSITLPYANYNKWTGEFAVSGQDKHGDKTYSGMVQSKLDSNNQIVFNHPEAGIFNGDTSVKDIYTNVGLPFVYKDGYYTFDANTTGAYFHADSEQGTSSTPASNSKLYFSDTPQSHDFDAADHRTNGWFPFNDASHVRTGEDGRADYFFGMQASIPFTMTSNGKIDPTYEGSEDIVFEFSGDDDVWVFIDGVLVLDIGGVHNGMDGTINFAQNTWSITAMAEGRTAQDVNNKSLSGTLFNEGRSTGVLNTTRETFAAKDEHTLTVFYLERGAGSSNCKIRFNLPIKDSVSVKKVVNDTDSAGVALTPEQMETANRTSFSFTLYKNDIALAGVNYLLYDVNGNYLRTATTGGQGAFTLTNGQTAKFIGEIGTEDKYYVVETPMDGWATPAWSYTAQAAEGYDVTSPQNGSTSMTVTASGSQESEDTITFTCANTLTHVDGTSITPQDDSIVIDYGLPVEIDVLANDQATGGTKSITEVSGAEFGTATFENNKVIYTPTSQLTDVEVLTYTAKVTSDNGVDSKTATANIYIIPATTMYYEEDFTGMVTFKHGVWTSIRSETNSYQETAFVGKGQSPYGSDPAYMDDSGDSNGTSMYVSTADRAAQFSYTFTGTGTSFFARTTNNTAYMRVVVSKNDKMVYQLMRETSYKTDDKETTLYNIPVFTYMAEEYGTYTVTVTLAVHNEMYRYGSDFWLDGIRVFNPMNMSSDHAGIATDAYAADGEAYMTNVTLREKLLADATTVDSDGSLVWDGENFVIFTDTNGKIQTASDYQSKGPKEEVYLDHGQSVTFSLTNWDRNSNKIYLGIKAPMGAGSVSINGNQVEISNTCDCYYDISDYLRLSSETTATFEIEASDAVISVTNIKVTGDAEFTIVDQPDVDLP